MTPLMQDSTTDDKGCARYEVDRFGCRWTTWPGEQYVACGEAHGDTTSVVLSRPAGSLRRMSSQVGAESVSPHERQANTVIQPMIGAL